MEKRTFCISRDELIRFKNLHKSILGKASSGMFYSLGQIIGKDMFMEIKEGENFFSEVERLLKEKKLIEGISFEKMRVDISGSIEVGSFDHPNCDIIRGILVALFEKHFKKRLYCNETECESTGSEKCVFEIESEVLL